MVQTFALTSILLGAGASLVAALPAPNARLGRHHHHHHSSPSSYSLPASSFGLSASSFSFPSLPTGVSGFPTGFPTGSGSWPYPTGGLYPTASSSSALVARVDDTEPIESSTVPIFTHDMAVARDAHSTKTKTKTKTTKTKTTKTKTTKTKTTKTKTTKTSSTKTKTTKTTEAASTTADATTPTRAASATKVASTGSSAGSAPSAASTGVTSVTASSGCTFTDAGSAASGKKSCKSIVLSGIAVPAGETLDMTGLADGTTVTFEGTTTFGYKEWDGPLISFSGTDITIQGASGHLINMGGEQWWDGQGSNGGKTKPKGFYAHSLTDSVIKDLNIKNTPIQCFSVNGASNLQINDVTIDDSEGDGDDGGHNTDAYDIGSSTGVYITGAVVKNQDDCVAVNSGTDISFTGGSCSGGHGLSIGSVGGRSDNNVANVIFSDSTISNSQNGARIKTVSGATGSVKNVTYSGITLSGISKYGIVIEQDYENGSPTGTPTDGVPITDITLSDITGSVTSDANPYYLLLASASDWTVTGVDVTGGKANTKCTGQPSGVSLC